MTFTASLDDIIAKNANGLLAAHKSWPRVELRAVCSITNGFPFPSDRFSRSDGFPLVRIRDIINGETETYYNGEYDDAYLVQRGELLVGMDGDFHSAMWRGRPALLNQRCCKITPNTQWIDRRFVAYLLPGYLAAIHANTAAQTVKHLSSNTVGDIKIPLPSLEEQSRISDKLDEIFSDLDAAVAGLKRIKTNFKRYRASVLQAAVEGRLTAEWRQEHPPSETGADLLARLLKERRAKWEETQLKKYAEQGKTPPKNWKEKYPEPVKPDTTGLPELPEGWVWGNLGQCFNIEVGATPSRAEPSYWAGNIPWVSSGEIQFCRIKETRESISAFGLANSSTILNPRGSVLLGMIGEGKTRGQAAILDIEAANNQNCAAIWVSASGMPPEFVYYNLELNYQKTRDIGSGNNQPALNKTRVQALILPLPPQTEQHEIIEEIESRLFIVETVNKTIDNALKRAAQLRQSILKRAFEGRLVPHDPNDEPASVLLERIRAERAEQAATVKPARTKRKGKGDAG